MTTKSIISDLVGQSISQLSPTQQDWLRIHLIAPKLHEVSSDWDGKEKINLWLVTDHKGNDDSSYRIVYDEELSMFGLECTMDNGVNWYMGAYGTFVDAVEHM